MREVREISIEQLHPNRHQPRLEFNEDALMELAQSIRENGLIQPITVREDEDGYEIIAGERRYKACILAGYSEVPCNVMSADEQKLAELALVENIQRENLTSIEEAKAYIQIMRSKMRKPQSTIANKVRLLNLPDEIQEGISSRKITERHARALLSVEPEKQQEVYEKIVKKGMNVRQAEQLITSMKETPQTKPEAKKPVFKGFARNIKIAVNTIYQAVEMVRRTGIAIETEEAETMSGLSLSFQTSNENSPHFQSESARQGEI